MQRFHHWQGFSLLSVCFEKDDLFNLAFAPGVKVVHDYEVRELSDELVVLKESCHH